MQFTLQIKQERVIERHLVSVASKNQPEARTVDFYLHS